MNIIHIASETQPFSSAGSMAETIFCLTRATAKAGHNVTVISPLYASIDIEKYNIKSTSLKTWVNAGFAVYEYEIFETYLNDVRFLFFKNDDLFNRIGLYGMGTFDYADNDIRFGTFCQAALNFLKYHNIESDIVHFHNWQTALGAVYKKLNFPDLQCKTVLTIHSIDNLGVFNKFTIEALNLPWDIYNIDHIEYYDNICFLKGGIVYADAITTLSPTFAEELVLNGGGIGVEEIFIHHADKLTGILNGICSVMWDPSQDTSIPANYSSADISNKQKNKEAVCNELGLDPKKPLVAFIQKLVPERGIELVLDALDEFEKNNINLIIFGPSSTEYNQRLQTIKDKYNNIKVVVTENLNKCQKEYAAADIIIMPSMYEPCGAGILIGMKYGDIPVCRKTGGLIDGTKAPLEKGYAFTFDDFNHNDMFKAVKSAVELVESSKRNDVVKSLMEFDHSWNLTASKYIDLYKKI